MTTQKKPKKETRADLARRVAELTGQLSAMYHFADATLDKASTRHLMGSGALITMHALGGRELINPVVIRDGLSDETIVAIRKDLLRSYELSVMFKPKGV